MINLKRVSKVTSVDHPKKKMKKVEGATIDIMPIL